MKSFSLRSKFALLGASLLAAAALTACGGGDTEESLNVGPAQARFINLTPGSPDMTLYRKGEYETSAGVLSYEESSKYYDTVTATSDYEVRNATNGSTLATASVRTENATLYTMLALPDGATAYKLVTISDPYDKPVDSNRARLRIVNNSPISGSYDVYVTPPGTDLATVSPQMSAVAYQTANPASGANSVFIGSGTYQIRLTPTGSKTAFFSGSFSLGNDDDELFVTLPTDDGLGVKILDVRHGDTQADSEILNGS